MDWKNIPIKNNCKIETNYEMHEIMVKEARINCFKVKFLKLFEGSMSKFPMSKKIRTLGSE